MPEELDAVVIGSGPNGLAAAITLAEQGHSVRIIEGAETIGGGLRSAELTGPGLIHDVCAAIHALGIGSPFIRSLPLDLYGLDWIQPEVLLAHPLSPTEAVLFHRSIDETAEGLGADAERYRHIVGSVTERWDRIEQSILGPILRLPDHPVDLVRFGLRALLPATATSRGFATEGAAALFSGCAAHAFRPLDRPLTSAFGLLLLALGHLFGWPFARGGSQAFAGALQAHFLALGGEVETGRTITDLADLPRARVILADTSPDALAGLLENRVPNSLLRHYRKYRYGPAAYKVDYALSGPVPWSNHDLSRAGTIHLGGTADAIAAAEAAAWAGRDPERPFTLVCQPTSFDESRSQDGRHALWVYAHVPNGSRTDHLEAIERQIVELAPDFRDVVIDRSIMTPADLEAHNPNLVGGDIAGGANTLRQLIFRPSRGLDPYTTPMDRVFLCSASTPPGAGAHGMSGHLAALSAKNRWL